MKFLKRYFKFFYIQFQKFSYLFNMDLYSEGLYIIETPERIQKFKYCAVLVAGGMPRFYYGKDERQLVRAIEYGIFYTEALHGSGAKTLEYYTHFSYFINEQKRKYPEDFI